MLHGTRLVRTSMRARSVVALKENAVISLKYSSEFFSMCPALRVAFHCAIILSSSFFMNPRSRIDFLRARIGLSCKRYWYRVTSNGSSRSGHRNLGFILVLAYSNDDSLKTVYMVWGKILVKESWVATLQRAASLEERY